MAVLIIIFECKKKLLIYIVVAYLCFFWLINLFKSEQHHNEDEKLFNINFIMQKKKIIIYLV